jgi:secreted trypsin-like serine protease
VVIDIDDKFTELYKNNVTLSQNVVVGDGENENNTTATSSKIVHGIAASATQFPYQVMIRSFNTGNTVSVCGGSILSDRYVLTAGERVLENGKFAKFTEFHTS